jgi:membrane protease YdiL (CAAX protease family)
VSVEAAARSSGIGVPVAVVGVIALALRPWAPVAFGTTGVWLGALYAAILIGSVAAPGVRDRARMPVTLVGVFGLVGIVIAAVASGRPLPAAPGGAMWLSFTILASVAEEACFRKVVYDELGRAGVVAAIAGSALLFTAIHIPMYGAAAFPVDLGAGLLLSWQRWASGTWTVPAATHVAANLLAVMR